MKRGLLQHAPTRAELERLYFELARAGAPSVGARRAWPYRPDGLEELLALAGEMLRYDPRLLSILLQFVLGNWQRLNPLELRRRMARMRWPQALLVVFEFARLARAAEGAGNLDAELGYLLEYLCAGWVRMQPAERFFVDADRPGSRVAQRRLGRNLEPYARWGFIGTERPIVDPATKRTVGRYDAGTRARALDELVGRGRAFTLADYLSAIDHAVSRQQARNDLRQRSDLVLQGRGRGARYHPVPGVGVQP